MKVCVVIPTYNEKDSIRRTLERVIANGPDYHVMVVDDNSPDDTAAVVAEYARQEPRVHLLVRLDDRGFGTAVRDGFRQALAKGADFIGQMDADGSHDPAELPRMRALLESGKADLVIGSRYVRGSKILGWGPWRYVNSHVANRLAKLGTGVPANDATNGLRMFRRQVLETLNLDGLLSRGYSVILETNFRSHRAGFRIAEVPITFHPREAGASKMGLREIYRFCVFLVRLRFHKIPKTTQAEAALRKAA
jgi:dolichol-phosphate mannosyltransferase